MGNAKDRKHSVSTFQMNEQKNELVSGRLELNLNWEMFPGI